MTTIPFYCGFCCHNITPLHVNILIDSVLQCPDCLYLGGCYQVINYNDPCPICFEHTDTKIVSSCFHWICKSCNDTTTSKCSLCRQSDDIPVIVNPHPSPLPDTIKPLFTSLSLQIIDILSISQIDEYDHHYFLTILVEYYKWLLLVADYGHVVIHPSSLIDKIWTTHIRDTKDYNRVCCQLFDRFIDYLPKYDQDIIIANYNNTIKFYISKFGTPPSSIWTIKGHVKHLFDLKKIGDFFVKQQSNGITLSLPYVELMTIHDIKCIIADITSHSIDEQRIVFNGIQHDNFIHLSDIDLHVGDTCHMILLLRGC